jgi:hypothetical protein
VEPLEKDPRSLGQQRDGRQDRCAVAALTGKVVIQ